MIKGMVFVLYTEANMVLLLREAIKVAFKK